MLSFVMITRNEGNMLDRTLGALGHAMQQGDRLIAVDLASQDDTRARLYAFGQAAGCDVIALEATSLHKGAALGLALEQAKTPYLMLLGPQDYLDPEQVKHLRQRLETVQPELALCNSGWWLYDPDHATPRADAQAAAACPAHPTAADVQALCPELRRAVLACPVWRGRRDLLDGIHSDVDLYGALIGASCTLAFEPAQVVLHRESFADPIPVLDILRAHVTALPRAAQPAALQTAMPRLDEAVMRTGPTENEALISGLEAFSSALPRSLRRQLRDHAGPAGVLFEALKKGGRQMALLHFVLGALATQQRQNDALAAQVKLLHQDVHAALPGPAYLRHLYDRARDL